MSNAASPRNVVSEQSGAVSLRRLNAESVDEGYLQWINDPEVNDFLESRFKTWSRDDLISYIEKMNNSEKNWLFGIFHDDVYVGNIKVGPVDSHHGRASIGLMIGNARYQRQGCAYAALKLILKFCFDDLGLRKLTAGCYAENKASLNLFLKAGFSIEGTLKNHVLWHGKACDVILLGCLKEDTI